MSNKKFTKQLQKGIIKTSKAEEITRESWILNTPPEWGFWLNEEIENTKVETGIFVMWWLGCIGLWIRTEGDTNLCVDFWCGTGKSTRKNPYMVSGHQMARMCRGKKLQPNLRVSPLVMDPFVTRNINVVVSIHYYNDHIDISVAAAVLRNCGSEIPSIEPEHCVDRWIGWGVPKERCITVRPGDSVRTGGVEPLALESFDRTAPITVGSPDDVFKRRLPDDMDRKVVNCLTKTPGGSIYHPRDSHYSNYYAKHGNEYKIDVALGSYDENPWGTTDKMTASNILRMDEALKVQVVVPLHHDTWSSFQADPPEIMMLYKYRRERMEYTFRPYIWRVGGKFTSPDDKERLYYYYPRGFDDCFTQPTDSPFPAPL